MKKLIIGFLVGIFITSNTFAAPIMPNVADYRAPLSLEESSSKTWAGYGNNVKHDQSPDYSTDKYYEVKFNTPITCYDCSM
tara:strand:+ start:444 stop:686 length:243 start_codon:yes stop_codon:yes gene_type:complete